MKQSSIIPALRYHDAVKAIDWLCENLGFSKHVVHESDGIVYHAQLVHGSGMIMIGSHRGSPYDQHIKIPKDIENYNTQSACIIVPNLHEHYAHSIEKKVEIVLPLVKEPHGSGYTCRDPEGYLWSFGDVNPWNQKTTV